MSDTSPHSNIISKKLSRCSNQCALLVFSQTAYSQTSASQNFSSFLKKFLQSEKNASGRYSNPQFGITDIIFPQGWHGTHIPSLIGLIVFMHAGNQRELAGYPFGQGQPTPLRPQ